MEDFNLWFKIGLEHIADWEGYDHILFLFALSGVYSLKDWQPLLILITAFTIGHSITLAVSTLNIFSIDSKITEFLIPLTILSTCVNNLASTQTKPSLSNLKFKYMMSLLFGFIHGIGFSYLLKSLLGKEQSIVFPLFSFNLGIEVGQILIVTGILIISLIVQNFGKIKQEKWNFFLSSATFGIAFVLTLERFFDWLN